MTPTNQINGTSDERDARVLLEAARLIYRDDARVAAALRDRLLTATDDQTRILIRSTLRLLGAL